MERKLKLKNAVDLPLSLITIPFWRWMVIKLPTNKWQIIDRKGYYNVEINVPRAVRCKSVELTDRSQEIKRSS